MNVRRVEIKSLATFVPPRVLTNADLEKMVDTSDEWILQRTGIRQRHIVDPGVGTSDLAKEAAIQAIQRAGLTPADIDVIIVGTVTPDMLFPSTACLVQDKIGATRAWGFDLSAACSAFTYSLTVGAQLVAAGSAKHVLVIGADVMSSIIDYTDRATCVLFGDGAGAVVLEAQDQPGMASDRGILTTHLRSDGRHKAKLYVDGGPSSTQTVGHLRMEGREVFKHAVGMITDVIYDAFKATGTTAEDIDWFVPHQANKRIIDASAHKLHIAPQKVVLTVDLHGNTSAASIPLALSVAVKDGRVKKGDLVLLEAMGGGFTWGSALLRW